MEPEKGDRSVTVTADDVASALADVGVVPSDTVLFHSSLSSMGWVSGGPNAVIDGFLRAVGPGGTIVVPTLWYHHTDPPMRMDDWDIGASPSYVGLVSETLRTRPDSIRSDNPSHSVSAIGRRAAEVTSEHAATPLRHSPWGREAFSARSPWQRLYEWNAAYCLIGVDLRVCTMRHLVEAMVVERALRRLPPCSVEKAGSRIAGRDRPGVWPYVSGLKVDALLTAAGTVTFGKIGSATLRCFRAREGVETLLAALESGHPEAWFDAKFVEWLRTAEG